MRFLPICCSAAWLIGCCSVTAQDFLDPLVVTAGRVDQLALDVPYTIDFINGDVFTEGRRRSLPEALEHTSGVLVQKTAYGHGSPFIRGFTGRQNLLLYDGVRINNSTYRSGPIQDWNTFDPWSIDRLWGSLTNAAGIARTSSPTWKSTNLRWMPTPGAACTAIHCVFWTASIPPCRKSWRAHRV